MFIFCLYYDAEVAKRPNISIKFHIVKFKRKPAGLWCNCNKLVTKLLLADSISSFKRRLSSFVVNVGFEHFSVN